MKSTHSDLIHATDPPPVVISGELRSNIVGVFGAEGAKWLDALPELLAHLAHHWRIQIHRPFPRLSYNYVAPATTEKGARVVLKTGVPGRDHSREVRALRKYAGRASVRVLRASFRLGAILLECVEPGTMLTDIEDDEKATRIAADCIRQLYTPLTGDHRIPDVKSWAIGLTRLRRRFGGGTGPLPAAHVERAEQLFSELFTSTTEKVLLHGDLQHYNILRAGDTWKVIDPKGMSGDPAYECGAWLRNPDNLLTRSDLPEIMNRRIAIFSEVLGYDSVRIRNWAYAQAILSAWWCIEDNDDCLDSITIADALYPP